MRLIRFLLLLYINIISTVLNNNNAAVEFNKNYTVISVAKKGLNVDRQNAHRIYRVVLVYI